jgi:hypothetical protein
VRLLVQTSGRMRRTGWSARPPFEPPTRVSLRTNDASSPVSRSRIQSTSASTACDERLPGVAVGGSAPFIECTTPLAQKVRVTGHHFGP